MLRLRELRKKRKITLKELGSELGLAESTIANYEVGRRQPDYETLLKLGEYFEVSVDYLLGKDDKKIAPIPQTEDKRNIKNIYVAPEMVLKPRLGTIACGKPILAVQEADTFDYVPGNIHCDFTLQCKGDSMINARIFDGDIVYIVAASAVDNGDIAAVLIGDEATLKRVYYTPGSDRITLRPCNPMYPDMEYEGETLNQIRILGKAIAFTSMIRQ